MRAAFCLIAILLVAAGIVRADAPSRSVFPMPRPDRPLAFPDLGSVVKGIDEAVAEVLRRRAPRPQRVVQGGAGITRLRRSPRPEVRPQNLRRRATVRRAGFPVDPQARPHAICGDPEILGTRLAPIPGRIAGCGVAEPVKVVSVAGIRLSQAATIDCPTAAALKTWVDDGVMPTIGRLGGGPVGLRVVAHYSCRTRNNQKGAKISEHAKGHAIDIAGIELANGVEVSVLDGWSDPHHGPLLERLHDAACGPFGTVLGPDADGFHRDHFHFDTARYRSGSYCR